MNKITSLSVTIILILSSCTDPNDTLGLVELDPTSLSEIITFGETSSFDWQTSEIESEDSLRTDNVRDLVLGEITEDPIFGYSKSSFYSQILLKENNVVIEENPIVDSVILSYTFSDFYGELSEFNSIDVKRIHNEIYKDSIYYSTTFDVMNSSGENLVEEFKIIEDLSILKIKLNNSKFGSAILELGSDSLVNNEIFLQAFKGISVSAESENTMIYLNPDGSNSKLLIYYHYENIASDTLSLEFALGGDVARINLFNKKSLLDTIQFGNARYIQSMAGAKMKISFNDLDTLKSLLDGKVLNKVTMGFSLEPLSYINYAAHENLFLVRVDDNNNDVFMSDFTIEGEGHFGGSLEDDKYEFNITRYFHDLLNTNNYTNDLYLLPSGAAINANRSILNEKIILTVHYSEL